MEFKEAVKTIGKEPRVELTWEECEKELEVIVNQRNDEYAEAFRKARIQEANLMARNYMQQHPQGENETKEEYVAKIRALIKDYVDNAPDEFTRNLRTYCHMGTALFNQMGRMIAEFNDFKEVYLALHEEEIAKYAERHKEEIEEQRKQIAEAKVQQERHERAVARKKELQKKCGINK
jgi:hypothetical protein